MFFPNLRASNQHIKGEFITKNKKSHELRKREMIEGRVSGLASGYLHVRFAQTKVLQGGPGPVPPKTDGR